MRTKKQLRGIKQKVREERKKEQRIALTATVAVLIVMISVSGFFVNSMLSSPSADQAITFASEPKAVIVDQLSLTYPNQPFVETTVSILKNAGYSVD
jgi:hypothetical protein